MNTTRIRIICSPSEFIHRLEWEVFGPDNMWYAGEALGREPTRQECLEHYFDHGGFENFEARHVILGFHSSDTHGFSEYVCRSHRLQKEKASA